MADPQGPWEPRSQRPRRRPPPFALWLILMGVVGAGVWGLAIAFPGQLSTTQDMGSLVGGVLWAALAAALVVRMRGDLGRTARHAATWLVIVGVLALGYAYRGELNDAAWRVSSELTPGSAVRSAPREMVFSQGPGGHFLVRAEVNGHPVVFLADTGASGIVLSPSDARRLGIDIQALDYDRAAETANGIGRSAGWRADTLTVGELRLGDVAMEVNQAPMSVSLLGMDFFRRLESFRVEGGRLHMRWRER
jgi:aspartyl protease family protein